MVAGQYDFTIEQGADFERRISWTDDAGTVIDTSTATARMQVRRTPSAPNPPLLELTDEDGRITLGGAPDNIILTLTAADTAALDFSYPAYYDLEVVIAGATTRVLEGRVRVSPEVTR